MRCALHTQLGEKHDEVTQVVSRFINLVVNSFQNCIKLKQFFYVTKAITRLNVFTTGRKNNRPPCILVNSDPLKRKNLRNTCYLTYGDNNIVDR